MRAVLVVIALAACGNHSPASTGDDGAADDDAGGGDARADASGDGGDDAMPASCEQLVPGAPIALDDQGDAIDIHQTALAWTGSELVLVRDELDAGNKEVLVVERRDAAGAIAYGPVRVDSPSSYWVGDSAVASLAYEPQARALLYVDGYGAGFRALRLDVDGAVAWAQPLWSACNGLAATVAAGVHGTDFVVGGQYYTCAGSSGDVAAARADVNGIQDTRFFADGTSNGTFHAAVACDAGCAHPLALWSAPLGHVRGAEYDPATSLPGAPFDVTANAIVDHQGLASDGTTFFHYLAADAGPVGSTTLSFRRYRPGAGYLDDGYATPGTRGVSPSVIWTGAGWLVAVAAFVDTTDSYAYPSDRAAFHITLWHFAPDGTLRATWANEDDAGLLPQLARAGGRIAMTWVRVGADHAEHHFLRYLDCH